MMTGPASPIDGVDQDRGPQTIAFIWTAAGLACSVIGLRFAGRRMIRATGADDWTMLITLCLYLIHAAFLTKDCLLGGMRHLYYLSTEEAIAALKWKWLAQPWVIMGFSLGKISIGLMILRFIGPCSRWRKWITILAVGSAFVISSVNIVLTYTQCDQVEALWDTQLVLSGEAHCWNPSIYADYAIFVSSWNILVDTLLAVLPATILYNLEINWKKKVGLSLLLGLGISAAVCGAVKTTFLASLNARSDFTWDTYDLYVWSVGELLVIMICGSIPATKPLYDRFVHGAKHPLSASKDSSHSGRTRRDGTISHNVYVERTFETSTSARPAKASSWGGDYIHLNASPHSISHDLPNANVAHLTHVAAERYNR